MDNLDNIILELEEIQKEGEQSWLYLKDLNSTLIKQYVHFKEQYQNHLLFFQVGDFYEIYDEDAKIVSSMLSMKLTKREIEGVSIPMCGMPKANGESFAQQLAKEGKFVTIISQRKNENDEVVRYFDKTITPGTIDSEYSNRDSQPYIMTAYEIKKEVGIVLLDTSTGEVQTRSTTKYGIFDLIQRFQPSEIHLYLPILWEEELLERFQRIEGARIYHVPRFYDEMKIVIEEHKLQHFQNSFEKYSIIAAHYFMMKYMNNLSNGSVTLRPILHVEERDYLYLHKEALVGLDVIENNTTKKKKGSLFEYLDGCVTAFGSRLLKNWLREPLLNPKSINQRLQVVDYFYHKQEDIQNITEKLKNLPDLERILGRIESIRFKENDLVLLLQSAEQIKDFFQTFIQSSLDDKIKKTIEKPLNEIQHIVEEFYQKINEETIIKSGYNQEYDTIKELKENGLTKIEEYAAVVAEKEKNNLKGLKLKDNKVLGYFFEITKKNIYSIPDYFVERGNISNATRFVTEELKNLEESYFNALEQYETVYRNTLRQIGRDVLSYSMALRKIIDLIGTLDILMNFSIKAHEEKLVRPQLNEDKHIIIQGGRHPLIEKYSYRRVVKNDAEILDSHMYLITGPNMGGKSSYLRMVAVLTLMAQVGCFVPANAMSFSPVDRILMRMGANDSLIEQQSTFSMEMTEVAYILYHATKDSLVLLDEIGRGTSTDDGIAIAQSVIEYINEKIQSKTLCSTHYHELIDLERTLPKFHNLHTEAKEIESGEIKLTYKIKNGGSSRSFGIEVAKKSGLPEEIIKRANELLQN